MIQRFPRFFLLVAIIGMPASWLAAAPLADIISPDSRKPIVERAQHLARPGTPPALPADLVHPFNPAAFGQPDPEEARAIAAAQAASAAAAVKTKPSTDRDVVELIASRIAPSGTLIMGGESLLIFGQKRLRVGDRLTVTYDERDYDLELTAISHTTFTLRLNNDEITRPIKLGKLQ